MSNRPTAAPRRTPSRPAAARDAAHPSRTPWIIGLVAVAVVGALVVAIVAGIRSNDEASASGLPVIPTGPVTFGDVQVQGAALPAAPSTGGADPAVGQSAPTLVGETFTGSPLTIPAAGKPAVVMFVAHWCPHCNAEVPKIVQDLDANGLPAGIDLYAVATGTNAQAPNFPPADWLHGKGWPVPTIADDQAGTAANAYGVSGYPTFVVLDAQGKVLTRTSGELPIDQFHQLIAQAQASATNATTGGSAPTASGGATGAAATP